MIGATGLVAIKSDIFVMNTPVRYISFDVRRKMKKAQGKVLARCFGNDVQNSTDDSFSGASAYNCNRGPWMANKEIPVREV